MSVLERSIMLAAVCCRLDAMVDGSCRSNYWCRRRGEVLLGVCVVARALGGCRYITQAEWVSASERNGVKGEYLGFQWW